MIRIKKTFAAIVLSIASVFGIHAVYAVGRAQGAGASAELLTYAPVDAQPEQASAAPSPMAAPVEIRFEEDAPGTFETVWSLWKRGFIAPALMLAFHLLNTIALARWSWLSSTVPWLANDRWLAIASSVQGAMAGLMPAAIAGSMPLDAVFFVILTAVAQFMRPSPMVVAAPKVPA